MLGSVALSKGECLVAQEQQGIPGTHSARLMASIDHLLATAGWTCGDIEGIAVAIGPGSFTGLRIGLATAKGMAMALGCPLAGVSSLDVLVLNGFGFAGTVVACIDARRGEIYAAAYRVKDARCLQPVFEKGVYAPEALLQKLTAIEGPMLLVGDGALAYGERFIEALGARVLVAPGAGCCPQAMQVALLALPHLAQGGDDLVALVPDYLRRSDAEIGFLGKAIAPGVKSGRQKRPRRKGER